MKSGGQQKEVSEEIKEVTKEYSELMDAEDVKKTTEVIDNLIQFDQSEQEELDSTVSRENNFFVLLTFSPIMKFNLIFRDQSNWSISS